MRRTWRVCVRLQVDDEDREIEFDCMMIDDDGRNNIVEHMLIEAVKKGFREVNKAHRKISVGEE